MAQRRRLLHNRAHETGPAPTGPEVGSISVASSHRRHPRWLIPLIATLSLAQPLLGLWLSFAPPEGTVATGLQSPDSAIFLQSMEMFPSDFHSSYATCQSTEGDNSRSYFAVPHLWLYGVLGAVANALGLGHFFLYMLANGIGAAVYLSVTYALLRALAPAAAPRAFLLFACSGGAGGALFLLARASGWHDHPDFETYFFRFAAYDLMEGPHLNPITYYGRLYYTLSLAGLTGGLLAIVQGLDRNRLRGLILLWPILFLASFINARFGWFFVAIVALYLIHRKENPAAARFNFFGWFALPVSVGAVMSFQFMQQNLAVIANHLEFGNMAMWLSPFLVVVWLHALLILWPLLDAVRRTRGLAGLLLRFGLFYVWSFLLLHVGYQAYYGTWLEGRDGPVAAAVSDYALYLAIFGAVVHEVLHRWRALYGKGSTMSVARPATRALLQFDWALLWFLGFLALSLSGFGHGWFLRFGPQRLEVLLWLPLCLLTALVLEALPRTPRRLATACLVAYGLISISVSMVYFQGPGERIEAEGPFKKYHAEVMHAHDAEVMDAMGSGTVLTLPPASDAVVRRTGNNVVFGVGSFNLSGKYFGDARTVAREFFDPGTDTSKRRAIVEDLCVRYVFISETWPVPKKVRRQLANTTWLRERARAGNAVLYQVMPFLDWEWAPYLASSSR